MIDFRVLVHAAAGGVGLAAVQLAAALGATVYATAGNPAKRRLLRQLGAHFVGSSRDINFVDDLAMVNFHLRSISIFPFQPVIIAVYISACVGVD